MSTTPQRGRLPVARRDRRTALAALAVLLILLGALASALLVFRSGERDSVYVAAHEIPLGQVISESDLGTAQAASTDGRLLGTQYKSDIVGKIATTRIPEGTLVNSGMYAAQVVPKDGQLVGIVLDANRRPNPVPRPGQIVSLIFVTNGNAVEDPPGRAGDALIEGVEVMSVSRGSNGTQTVITVLVPRNDAGEVARLAASGNLAMTQMSEDTKPVIKSGE